MDEQLRSDIALSWRRASATGLDPGASVDPNQATPVDASSRLYRAAAPVLDDLTGALGQASYTIILADRDARITAMRVAHRSLRPALERVGAVVGRSFTEATTGTNSIATAHELRRGISVHGAEHYLEAFKRFACYGTPIFDTLTGRLAGVLDITCLAEDANELLRPFLLRGARDIEARLFEDASRSQRSLFHAFQDAARRNPNALVALGADLVLTNNAATDLIQPADQVALQMLAADVSDAGSALRQTTLELVSGGRAEVSMHTVDGGVLISLTQLGAATAPIPRRKTRREQAWHPTLQSEIAQCIATGTSVLVQGEAGTGLSTVARRLAPNPTVEIDAATATPASVPAASPAHQGTWLVTDLHLIRTETAAQLLRTVQAQRPRLVVTIVGELLPHTAIVTALCPARIELPTLRSRREDIPAVASAMLAEATTGAARFTPAALRALAASEWPGNLRELRTVVDEVAARRSAGDVPETDLPIGHRDAGRAQLRGALWQAERDAIVQALQTCVGNKVHAARLLGIGRNTLYRRMRTLGISG